MALNTQVNRGAGSAFRGTIEGVLISLSSIATATKITMRAVDADGNIILPDTEADIATDIAVATDGSVAYFAGLAWASTTDELKIYCKTDAGTVTVSHVSVSWRE